MKKAQLKVEKRKEKEEQAMRQAQLKEEKKKEKAAQAMKKVQLKEEKTKEKAAQAMKKVQLEEEKKILNKEMAEKQMQSMKSETKNKTPTTDTKQEAANETNGRKTPSHAKEHVASCRAAALQDQHTATNITNEISTVDALTTTTNEITKLSQKPAAISNDIGRVEGSKRPKSDDSRITSRHRSSSKTTLRFENESSINETVSMSKLSFTIKSDKQSSVDMTSTNRSLGDVSVSTDQFFDHVHTRMEPCRHSSVISNSADDLTPHVAKDVPFTNDSTPNTTLKRKLSGRSETKVFHKHVQGNIFYSHDDIVLNYQSPYAADERQRSFIKRKKKPQPNDSQEGLTYSKDDIAENYQSPYAVSDRQKTILRKQKIRMQRKQRLRQSREEWESTERRIENENIYQAWLRNKQTNYKYKAKY